jgi:hypothetical protein
MDWAGLGQELQEFEREQWGTNDFPTIISLIEEESIQNAKELLTGMDEEQADWEADE